jgi:hypothetical protein
MQILREIVAPLLLLAFIGIIWDLLVWLIRN